MQFEESSKQNLRLQEQIISFLIGDPGKGDFKETPFEEVETTTQGQEFSLQVEGHQPVETIKTMPFQTYLGLSPSSFKAPEKKQFEFQIKRCPFVTGFNHGHETVQIVEGKICRAIGTNIFFHDQMYNGHSLEICVLKYLKSEKRLYSGSIGRCPEIVQWQLIQGRLQIMNRWNQPSKSIGVSHILAQKDQIITISKINLHKSSQIFIFDRETGKRFAPEVKIGKVIEVLTQDQNYMIVNEKGISSLMVKNQECQLVTRVQNDKISSACFLEEEQNILVIGHRSGQLDLLKEYKSMTKKQFNLHQGWILGIVLIQKKEQIYYLASSGIQDSKIFISRIDLKKLEIEKFQEIKLEIYCRSLSVDGNKLICGLRNGKLEIYERIEQKFQKKVNEIEQKLPHFTQNYLQNILYDRLSQKYFYSSLGKPILTSFQIKEDFTLAQIKVYNLRQKPNLLDIYANIIAYISVQNNQNEKLKESFMKKKQNKGANSKVKSFLLVQDYMEGKLLGRYQIQGQNIGDCTRIKYSPFGDMLALGFSNGFIRIYNSNKSTDYKLICHQQRLPSPIQDLIWSEDGKRIKSLTYNNIVFDDLIFEEKTKALKLVKLGTSIIKQAKWVQTGKFSWESRVIWSRANSVYDITSIKGSKNYLFACMEDGKLRIYDNPSRLFFQQLPPFFKGPFNIFPIRDGQSKLGVLIYGEGKAFTLQLNI